MSDSIIIGVDHGYAAMKTAHFAFPSGLVAYEYEPYTLSNVLEYGGKFYVVGSGRQPLQKDKTQAEDYYLLTLAAIAKELEYRNAGTMADVHLATGLPLTSFGRDKKAFRDYLCRDGKPVSFRFECLDYTIMTTIQISGQECWSCRRSPERCLRNSTVRKPFRTLMPGSAQRARRRTPSKWQRKGEMKNEQFKIRDH